MKVGHYADMVAGGQIKMIIPLQNEVACRRIISRSVLREISDR